MKHVADYLDKYSNVLVCEIKDLPADFVHSIRKELRTIQSEVLCGKTTVIQKAIHLYLEGKEKGLPKAHTLEGIKSLSNSIADIQVCVIFTNSDISKVTAITNKFVVEKQAKSGAISPIEVILKAGPTGMDSSQIEYFQALKIQTKVIKNQLEIITDSKILQVGQKITLSEINLMKKFNIKPYKHMVQIKNIYMGGKLYGSEILKINEEVLSGALAKGIKNVASFSLQTCIPNQASAPHLLAHAFNNVLGLSGATGVEIKGVKIEAKKASPKKEDKPKEEKKVDKKPEKKAPEPEPEEDLPLDMFG